MQEADKDTPKGFANDKEKRQGFEQIVRQYSEKLYWTVRRIVINHDDANDVLQNVFIKVWKSIGDFEQRASLSTWLYRIAVNESLDFLRRQKDTASIDESGAGANIANHLLADDYFDGDRAQALLQEAIATLPEVQRVVFTMLLRRDEVCRHESHTQHIGRSTEGKLPHSDEEDYGLRSDARTMRQMKKSRKKYTLIIY